MLVQHKHYPIPETMKIVDNYGTLTVRLESGKFVSGRHCVLEGTEENIKAWLQPHGSFLLGEGSPMLQQFTQIKYEGA